MAERIGKMHAWALDHRRKKRQLDNVKEKENS